MNTGSSNFTFTMGVPPDIEFVPRQVDCPDAAGLLRAFYDEQVERYGFAESIDLDPDSYRTPNGAFVVIYRDREPVGCGGCRWYDRASGTAEIKKTYLVPPVRGLGVGRALLTWLESQSLAWGARRVILETGVRNTAALGLFVNTGYRPIPRYVPGRDPSINRAFVKPLTPDSPAKDEDARHAIAQ
jgi:GNAT superfamily N-acetyltransferase